MHFLRARRQRKTVRLEQFAYKSVIRKPLWDFSSFYNSTASRLHSEINSMRAFAYFRWMARSRSAHHVVSVIHCVRRHWYLLSVPVSADKLIDFYLKNQEDPWVREKILEHCANKPALQYITADYLDRLSKLRVFF
jgi:hypothetical protein